MCYMCHWTAAALEFVHAVAAKADRKPEGEQLAKHWTNFSKGFSGQSKQPETLPVTPKAALNSSSVRCRDEICLTNQPPRTKLICMWDFAARRPPSKLPLPRQHIKNRSCKAHDAGMRINIEGADTKNWPNMQISFGAGWAPAAESTTNLKYQPPPV